MPTVALLGTTASGKSGIAMEFARRHGAVELLCVDSMSVYRGMDIGTAKPAMAARVEVPHHLLDLIDPDEEFSVTAFREAADTAMAGITSRGNRALLVGGTGLYLRAIVDRLEFPGRWPEVAAQLCDEDVSVLHARLAALDPVAAQRTTVTNRRRIVRALEVTIGSGRLFSSFGPGLEAYPPTEIRMVGLRFDPEEVDLRIEQRLDEWMQCGLLEEVGALAQRPGGLSRTARQALGYRELLSHIEEGAPLDDCVAEAIRRTRRFARRQWAWFRRDPRIRWIEPDEDPVEVLDAASRRCEARSARLGG